ncbi:cysteine-rich repeat secretory protein 12-like protein [Tanacetum coccineum]
MTPYDSNVNSLFSSLADSASLCNFNKFEISPPGNSQCDDVYGLFQCRGDLNSAECKDCVVDSLSQLKTTCPVSTGGTIQLEGCLVKYDNTSFFGVKDKMEASKKCGPSGGSNSDVLSSIDNVLSNLISENNQYFRKGDFGSIRGVAQCVQDLSSSDCQDCLLEASGRLRSECESSTWGNMYLGKCYIKYATDNGGEEMTVLQWILNAINPFVSAGVSYLISKLFTKKVEVKVYEAKDDSQKALNIAKGVEKEVKVEEKKKEEKREKKKAEAKMGSPHYTTQMPTPYPCPCPYSVPDFHY